MHIFNRFYKSTNIRIAIPATKSVMAEEALTLAVTIERTGHFYCGNIAIYSCSRFLELGIVFSVSI